VTGSDVLGGHADSFTTSIALARHPERARVSRMPPPNDGGVIGDAAHGSAELGERLWKETVERVAALLEALVSVPLA
jgi:creatinine amidohydrolase